MKQPTYGELEARIVELENELAKHKLYNNNAKNAQQDQNSNDTIDFLNLLLEHTTDSIFFKDRNSKFLKICNNQARFYGLNNPAEAIGKSDFDYFLKEEAQLFFDTEQDIMKTGRARINYEENQLDKNGKLNWFSTSKIPFYNNHGEVAGIFGISRNITDKKLAESRLIQEQQRVKALMDYSPDNIYFKDLESKFVEINLSHAKAFGLDHPDDAIGKSDMDFFQLEYAQQAFADEQIIIQTGIPIVGLEEKQIWPDGKITWVSTSKIPHRNSEGKIIGIFGISRDITSIKEAEKALRESEEKLSTLFESMTEMVILHELVYDDAGKAINYKLIDCNNAFSEITGIRKEHAEGKLVTEVYKINEPPYLDEFIKVVETGKPCLYDNYSEDFDKHFSNSVVATGKNNFASISTDITEQVKAQQIIHTKNKELEQILYVASHDLRSPLVNVDGYGRELEYSLEEIRKCMEDSTCSQEDLYNVIKTEFPEIVTDLKHIRNSTNKMDTLLKGLLKLSRLGRAALSITSIDMDKLVAEVCASFEYQIKRLEADVIVGKLPHCMADEIQLSQVFSNLIGNAIKHANSADKLVIKISGKQKNKRVIYCVEDNGMGIQAHLQERIFELFHRLDPNKTEGEGLGLSIVKQILDRLNGHISIKSDIGKGCRFYVSLPKSK